MNCLEGSGELKSDTRLLKPFTRIELNTDAKVIITKDTVQSIRVEAQPNVLKVLTTEVSGKWLYIDLDGCLADHKPITVYISTPSFETIEVDGSGSVEGRGSFNGEKITLSIDGSGSINIGLSANEVKSEIKGSGNMNLSGSARKFDVDLSGSGDVNAQEMPSGVCKVNVRGSGNCRIFAINKLAVDIAGSGNVFYKGTPDITTNITGSGKLEKNK
jgi:hypothetical protein